MCHSLSKYNFTRLTRNYERSLIALIIFYSISIFLSLNTTNNDFNLIEFLFSVSATVVIIIIFRKFIIYIGKRLDFISKAYYIDIIKNNHSVRTRKLQHFLDFHKLFEKLTNISFKKFTFNENFFSSIYFKDSLLKQVTFDKCMLNRIHFNNTQFDEINFKECKIKYLRFDNCAFSNINIETSSFKEYSWTKQLLFQFVLFNNYIFNKILRDNKKSKYSYYRIYVRKIIFANIEITNFDDQSINSFKTFIQNNDVKRKEILCNKQLKDVLFSN